MPETTVNPIGSGSDGGGPPVDLGNATPVVVDKPSNALTGASDPKAVVVDPKAVVTPDPKETVVTPDPKAAKTILDTPAEKTDDKAATPADWPDDWRQKMAANDAKMLKRLERYNSPLDMFNAYRAMEQRLSSGEYKKALPANPTPEEVAEFRKSNGVPDKPEDYDVNIGNGFVWGEADKPALDSFRQYALEHNLPNSVVRDVVGWYAAQQQQVADEIANRDENHRINGIDALRAEWGNNFKGNLNAAQNLFEGNASDLWGVVMGARGPDGRLLGNNPDVVKFISRLSREINPFSTLVPEAGSSQVKTAEARLQEINGLMADKSGPYWRGPQSASLQQEWRDLHEAIEKNKSRAA